MGGPAPSIVMQDRFGKNERNFDIWRRGGIRTQAYSQVLEQAGYSR
jgi:hypothetical protein